MNVVLLVLIVAVFSSVLILGLIAVVIAGIHASERRMSFNRMPRTWPEMVTRRVLGVPSGLSRKPASFATKAREVSK